MDQIGVVGLSYRHAGTEDIAGFTLPKDELTARLASLRESLGTAEVVYLATCNRVEVAFAMPEGEGARDMRAEIFHALTGRPPKNGEARSTLRAWTGEAAVEHLFLVACGLDSAQAGEREILAQMRLAWEAARTAAVCGPVLDRIMGEALSLAGRLQRLASAARPPSLADLAAERMLHHVNGGAVALIGVSPMTKRCGELLHNAGISVIVVNRTTETAEEFALTINGTAVALDVFRAQPCAVAGVIVATGGNEPVLAADALRRLAARASQPPLIIDFGLPPNIDPAAAKAAGLTRIGMNEMIQAAQDRRLSQLLRLAPMRAAIDDRLARLRGQLATRAIGRQLAELRNSMEQIAAAETDRALAEELHGLTAEQQAQVRRVATTIAHRLAHLPLAGLRAAAAHANAETVDAFFREARLQRPSRAAPAHTSPHTEKSS